MLLVGGGWHSYSVWAVPIGSYKCSMLNGVRLTVFPLSSKKDRNFEFLLKYWCLEACISLSRIGTWFILHTRMLPSYRRVVHKNLPNSYSRNRVITNFVKVGRGSSARWVGQKVPNAASEASPCSSNVCFTVKHDLKASRGEPASEASVNYLPKSVEFKLSVGLHMPNLKHRKVGYFTLWVQLVKLMNAQSASEASVNLKPYFGTSFRGFPVEVWSIEH